MPIVPFMNAITLLSILYECTAIIGYGILQSFKQITTNWSVGVTKRSRLFRVPLLFIYCLFICLYAPKFVIVY